jgi:hypothetical protein
MKPFVIVWFNSFYCTHPAREVAFRMQCMQQSAYSKLLQA